MATAAMSLHTPLDLSPGYRELAPPPALRDALECLWVRVSPLEAPPANVLPDGGADIIWHAGGPALVAGPDTVARVVAVSPGAVIVGARFNPGAGGSALGLPLSELRDARAWLAELRPELGDRLGPELTPQAALHQLAATVARLVAAGPPDPAVRAAARRLAHPRTHVKTLASDLGLSERQLRRRCHAAVGYGPKTLQRILRFRRFLTGLDVDDAEPDLARLALDAGYADQAHLTRDSTRLAGLAPAALALSRRAY
jgi:methylphosphotriester-DNA--protein-cysteine methyltransferase